MEKAWREFYFEDAGGPWRAIFNTHIVPHLDFNQVFDSKIHRWELVYPDPPENPMALRGYCPWHELIGLKFALSVPTLQWSCMLCELGGDALDYLWRLRGQQSEASDEDVKAMVLEMAEALNIDCCQWE